MKYTKEEWEAILQDSGMSKKKAKTYAPNVKQRVEKREKKEKEKIITESDITEPLNTFKDKKKK